MPEFMLGGSTTRGWLDPDDESFTVHRLALVDSDSVPEGLRADGMVSGIGVWVSHEAFGGRLLDQEVRCRPPDFMLVAYDRTAPAYLPDKDLMVLRAMPLPEVYAIGLIAQYLKEGTGVSWYSRERLPAGLFAAVQEAVLCSQRP